MNLNTINNRLIANLNMPMADKLVNLKSETRETTESIFTFGDIMSSEMNKVNDMQIKADDISSDFIAGEVDNIHDVLIATEEAKLALELAVQVRNKFIEAYKEINSMQL